MVVGDPRVYVYTVTPRGDSLHLRQGVPSTRQTGFLESVIFVHPMPKAYMREEYGSIFGPVLVGGFSMSFRAYRVVVHRHPQLDQSEAEKRVYDLVSEILP